MKLYLAGPINGCTDDEARGWREAAKLALPDAEILDPMSRDYRGKELENVAEIIEGDKRDIQASDVVLVNASRPTWGTAMEIPFAFEKGKRVIAFGTARPSPWLVYHTERIVLTLEEALEIVKGG